MDYSAEFLPVIILRQPSKTDLWGNRQSTTFKTIPGIGVLPIGMRLLWNDGGRVKPYYVIKAGVTLYTQKAFSQDASYENLGLDQSLGMQFRVSDRTDFRTGFGVFHQSNGFVVPSNPGLDEMNWNIGVSYHLDGAPASYWCGEKSTTCRTSSRVRCADAADAVSPPGFGRATCGQPN